MTFFTNDMTRLRGSHSRSQNPGAVQSTRPKEVCCWLFEMAGRPMYKPTEQAHIRALTRPGQCVGCKSLSKCQPPSAVS